MTMERSVVLHGRDAGVLCRLGRAVARRLGAGFEDMFVEERDALKRMIRSGGRRVIVAASESLVERVWRVEAMSLATVVAVGPGVGGLAGEGRLEELMAGEFREGHGFFGEVVDEALVVDEIVKLAESCPVAVAAGEGSYLVDVGRGVVERALSEVDFGSSVLLYLTDENVQRLHGVRVGTAMQATGLRIVEMVLVPGEERKCLGTLGEIFDRALGGGIDRSSWVVAVGGGVTTDIGGLVAALWMRGLRWIGIPTTLLGMVDASVGGKTAVDHGMGKNAVGAFWQPSRVICDVEFLRTESERNYVGALSEVVKTALVGDAELLEMLWNERSKVVARDLGFLGEVVRRCVQVKARIVGLDAREVGVRAVLNFGHTVGHALEVLGEYRRYTHGEAVSLGMVVALRLGVRLGYTPRDLAKRVEEILVALGLPVVVSPSEVRAAGALLGHDKKRSGSSIRVVFARGAGMVTAERIGLQDLRELVEGFD
jgi:shikimate kinase / 3-dehydroquinate synthase